MSSPIVFESHCWMLFHKSVTSRHLQNRCSMVSSYWAQKEHVLSVLIFNFVRYSLVPNILLIIRYWNQMLLLSITELKQILYIVFHFSAMVKFTSSCDTVSAQITSLLEFHLEDLNFYIFHKISYILFWL